jgi:ribosomal protein L20
MKTEKEINDFVEEFKTHFSGSTDYLSGVNDAAYSMYRKIASDISGEKEDVYKEMIRLLKKIPYHHYRSIEEHVKDENRLDELSDILDGIESPAKSEAQGETAEEKYHKDADKILRAHMKKFNLFHTNYVLVLNAMIEAMEYASQQRSETSDDLRTMLESALRLGCQYKFRYYDYEEDEFTVPVLLNEDRIERLLSDLSIAEVQIIFKNNGKIKSNQ